MQCQPDPIIMSMISRSLLKSSQEDSSNSNGAVTFDGG